MKEIKTLEDLEQSFDFVSDEARNTWADLFWTWFSQGVKSIRTWKD